MNYDFYMAAMEDAACYFSTQLAEPVPEWAVGDHVRIVVGQDAGRRAIVAGYDPDKLVAPYTLRVQGWPADLPGQDYEGDEFEEEC